MSLEAVGHNVSALCNSSMPVTVLTRAELNSRLKDLRKHLGSLPNDLPCDVYDFRNFEVSDEDSLDIGRSGALNRALECLFCPQGRTQGPFKLKGRGEGLDAIVDVLSRFTEEFPNDVILQKWIEDLIQAAEHTIAASASPMVPCFSYYPMRRLSN